MISYKVSCNSLLSGKHKISKIIYNKDQNENTEQII